MSLSIIVSAMKAKVGSPLRKLVLIKLADNANDKGECWPSYAHIADHCEMGRSTVRKHIKKLEEDGFLVIENRKGPKGNSTNLYHIVADPMLHSATHVLHGDTPPMLHGGTGICHSFEPVTEPVTEPFMSGKENPDSSSVIEHFNKVCSTKYRSSTKSHSENINARLKEGHSVEDLKIVIDSKFAEWGGDPKMAQYIRPQTLFSAGKFQGYLTAAKTKPQAPKSSLHDIKDIDYGKSGRF